MFKLADEVGNLREDLMFLQRVYEKKKQELGHRKQQMQAVHHKYLEVCSVLGKTTLSFQEFNARKREKIKTTESSRLKKHFKKPTSGHKLKLQSDTGGKNAAASMDLK